MERYRPASQPDGLMRTPPDEAISDREPVEPTPFSQSVTTIFYEAPLPVVLQPTGLKPSGQIYSADEAKREAFKAQIIAKIQAPYEAQEKQLKRLLKRVHQASDADSGPYLPEKDNVLLPIYATSLGDLSFAELIDKTRKYAAYALNTTYHVSPADVGDGLQAGYLHLWRRLQDEPDLLKDKAMAWIGKGVIYKGLHALRGDWRYQQRVVAEEGRSSTDRRGKHSPESRAADIQMDIYRAIAEVAEQAITTGKGKQANQTLWALYGLTMLQVSASEASRIFSVREQTMQAAYNRVREQLKALLPEYAPKGETRLKRKHGREKLPGQDMAAIRQGNRHVSAEIYQSVQKRIDDLQADTRRTDQIALAGIRQGIQISTQARNHHIPQYQMQRAYQRVHLMIGAARDPSVRMLRPERRSKAVFILTAENTKAVQTLAEDLLNQPKNYEKLVALHAYISNLAISTTAKHFNIPTSTLRYYAKRMEAHLATSFQRPQREGKSQVHSEEINALHESAGD